MSRSKSGRRQVRQRTAGHQPADPVPRLERSDRGTRAGKNGAAFEVIAREIQRAVEPDRRTVSSVSDRIASIATSVDRSQGMLREIASVDMSEHILAKDRLDALLTGIMAQNDEFTPS